MYVYIKTKFSIMFFEFVDKGSNGLKLITSPTCLKFLLCVCVSMSDFFSFFSFLFAMRKKKRNKNICTVKNF